MALACLDGDLKSGAALGALILTMGLNLASNYFCTSTSY